MRLLPILTIILKRKKLIISVFLTITTVVAAGTLLMDPVFQAHSSILVKMFRDDTSRPGILADKNTVAQMITQDEMINTEIQILTDREVAAKVIETLRLEKLYPQIAALPKDKAFIMDRAVRKFAKDLQVEGVRKSNVIDVTFQHSDPVLAANAVNLLVDIFKQKHLALHSDPQSSFITSQLAAFEEKLKASEKKLQDYQQSNRVYSLEDQRTLLLKQRTDFDTSYKIACDNISEGKKRVMSLRSQLQNIAKEDDRYTQTERDRIITDAKGRLLELQLKEQELRRKYTETNRLVVDARKEVEIVEQFLKEQERIVDRKVKTGNPVYQSMETDLFRAEAELNSQIAKADALKTQIKEIDGQLSALDATEATLASLKREVAIDEKNYKTYVDTHEDARIAEAMNRQKISNISVIESAVAPVKPVKPKTALNIAIGLFVGMVSSLAAAFWAESMADTFPDPQSVEKYLGLPVLVTIPTKED